MDFSHRSSFTPPNVLKKGKDNERFWAGGREERQTVRQSERKEKEGWETKIEGSREREDTRKEGCW